MDEQPLDYVAAALIYLLYDDSALRSHQTAKQLTDALNKRFDADLPWSATFSALIMLTERQLLTVISSRFADQYYSVAYPFRDKVAAWRAEKSDQAAVAFDNFMNGPSHWMNEAFNSKRFKEALRQQLEPIDASSQTILNGGSASAHVSALPKKLVGRIEEAISALERSAAGNAEKSQAYALLSASKSLAEAPDPPLNIIWDLLQRANNIAGIASLMVAIIALFASH